MELTVTFQRASAALFLASVTPAGVSNSWSREHVIQVRRHPHSGVSERRCVRFGFPSGNGTLGPEQSGSDAGVTQASVAARAVSVDQRRGVSGTISGHAMVQIPQKSRRHYHLGRYGSKTCIHWQMRWSLFCFGNASRGKIPSIEKNDTSAMIYVYCNLLMAPRDGGKVTPIKSNALKRSISVLKCIFILLVCVFGY